MNYINNIKKINYIIINQYVIYHLIIIKKVKICFFEILLYKYIKLKVIYKC